MHKGTLIWTKVPIYILQNYQDNKMNMSTRINFDFWLLTMATTTLSEYLVFNFLPKVWEKNTSRELIVIIQSRTENPKTGPVDNPKQNK